MVIGVLGFGDLPHCELDWWCFMGYPCRWVGSHHAMGFGCSYSEVDTEGVEVKIPFDKRPKTRVQGVVGMWFPSSFFRFGSAGVVVCVELGLGVE